MVILNSLRRIFLSGCLWNALALPSLAQIIPDDSLGNEGSVIRSDVTLQNGVGDYLEGGARRENNLFHSFDEFSISEQGQAYFASPAGIDNIFTRVTGVNPSQIFGTLGVDGGANLFLLNPNGIIFGQNSQLDLAGSFLATTAESYIFDNGFDFGVANPEAPPLLTMNIPVGLQFGSNPGNIINRSRISAIAPAEITEIADATTASIPEGLRIAPEKTLSLLGGKIIVEGGYFNTSKGKIELGGVGADNLIKLNADGKNWQTDYTEVDVFADIKLKQQAGIDGGNTGGTQITLRGKDISLGYDWDDLAELGYELEDFFSLESLPALDELPPDRTTIIGHNHNHRIPVKVDIQASEAFSIINPGKEEQNILVHTSGTGNAGIINLAADSIVTYGASLESWTLAGATGNSGSINFTGRNMSVQYGGGGVNTFSQGKGGKIEVALAKDLKIQSGGFGSEVRNAGDGGVIKIDAQNLEIRFAGFGVGTFASGNGGKIDLNIANELKVISGGFGADAFAAGDGGRIEIEAQNIEFIDAGLGANTKGRGKGGQIAIDAKTILLENGVISAESGQNTDERNAEDRYLDTIFSQRNAGDSGNIFIKAQTLAINNGNITTSTVGTGNAGNIELRVGSLSASGGELLSGINSFTGGTGNGGNIIFNGDRLKLSAGARVGANSTDLGQAGDVIINTQDLLQLENGGTISVDGGATGLPGNIILQGKDFVLNQAGKISATTNRGRQGNISLTGEQLFLRDRSQIATNAGEAATGGNIFIELTKNLLGLDRSEIVASAEQGQGGEIQITARGIFFSADSKINASSRFGVDGLIEINTLAIDPDSGLILFPTEPLDPKLNLTRGCNANSDNKFVSVGKGGLPESPLTSIVNHESLADLEVSSTTPLSKPANYPQSHTNPIVEAQNWKFNQQGKIELVAALQQKNLASLADLPDCLQHFQQNK